MFDNSEFLSQCRQALFLLIAFALITFVGCGVRALENSKPPSAQPSVASEGYTNFETEPVHPLALSADGRYLFALNTADDRLEIFDAQGEALRSIGETAVGLRPVALALCGSEAWVVNHLSDSVNVVDVSDPRRPRVMRTLQVGDEPRGIVVAGPNQDRVLVASARRGETLTPGIGRAQVWMFDAARPEAPPKILTLFGAKPRALAASADGRLVYAAVFLSGNGTTTVSGEDAVRLGRARPLHFDSIPYGAVPKQGAIVRHSQRGWRDYSDQDWSAAVPFQLPDYDVFVIDLSADEPRVVGSISNVGTVLFNLAVQPGSGEVWVSNTEAFNFIPYESRLRGRFAENRVTRIGRGSDSEFRVRAVNLNPHIASAASGDASGLRELSLAQPLDLVFQPDGRRAYVAAFGSSKVAVLDDSARVVDRLPVGFGPGGLALDPKRQRLYVLNHLDATVSVIDLIERRTLSPMPLRHNPMPPAIRQGRSFFYDAALTSEHGEQSCATCHVFADMDGVAWNLGDSNGTAIDYPVALRNTGLSEPQQNLHPLKGPMMTQSLRGLANTAPYHWRGDRFGVPSAPGGDIASFKNFNPAFVSLMGRSAEISDAEMETFARFIMSIRYPPNPNQRLDRGMDAEQKAGFDFFTGPFLSDTGQQNCVSCHVLPLGTNRLINFEGLQIGRDMKTAHLRNLYDKVGRFNVPGPQVSGFGLLHEGTFDSVVNFLRLDVFSFPGATEAEKDLTRRRLQDYVMAFDTGMAPAVGRQLTVTGDLADDDRRTLNMLAARATAGDCDLTARAWEEKTQRGWLYRDGSFQGDRSGDASSTLGDLLSRYHGTAEPLTFTCVPPGDGRRSALDRDLDGYLDGDELIAGSDPTDPRSVPPGQ